MSFSIFERIYTTDDAGAALTVIGGAPTVFRLSSNPRATIVKLIIQQLDGAADGFIADLYSNEDDADNARPTGKVIPTQTASAAAMHTELFGGSHPYRSRHASDPHQHEPHLWLRLDPAGAGDKSFRVALTVGVDD